MPFLSVVRCVVLICFLQAEYHNATEIHHWLCHILSDTVMNDNSVTTWCRKFKDGHTNVHNERGQELQLWLLNSFKKSTKLCVKNIISWCLSFLMNFLTFQGLVSSELSQRDWVTNKVLKDGVNCWVGYPDNALFLTRNYKNWCQCPTNAEFWWRL